MSNAIAPSVVPPSPYEWPNTLRTLTGIAKGSNTTVTCPDHGFTASDENITSVMFKQVLGMQQINGVNGRILTVIDDDNFTVDINSTNFYPYASAGVIVIDTGTPPVETISFQTLNTPFYNIK